MLFQRARRLEAVGGWQWKCSILRGAGHSRAFVLGPGERRHNFYSCPKLRNTLSCSRKRNVLKIWKMWSKIHYHKCLFKILLVLNTRTPQFMPLSETLLEVFFYECLYEIRSKIRWRPLPSTIQWKGKLINYHGASPCPLFFRSGTVPHVMLP